MMQTMGGEGGGAGGTGGGAGGGGLWGGRHEGGGEGRESHVETLISKDLAVDMPETQSAELKSCKLQGPRLR